MRGKEKTSHQSLTALQQRDWGPRVLRADESVTPFESVYTLAGLIPSLTMIRLTIYEQTPGWDESFGQPCEDTDLSLHVALQSEVRYLPEKLLLHRRHSEQSTIDVSHLNKQEEKLYNKWTRMRGTNARAAREDCQGRLVRTGPLEARKGFDEGKRLLRKGEIRSALRFFVGAFRKKLEAAFVRA
jgi:hypothetical protein